MAVHVPFVLSVLLLTGATFTPHGAAPASNNMVAVAARLTTTPARSPAQNAESFSEDVLGHLMTDTGADHFPGELVSRMAVHVPHVLSAFLVTGATSTPHGAALASNNTAR